MTLVALWRKGSLPLLLLFRAEAVRLLGEEDGFGVAERGLELELEDGLVVAERGLELELEVGLGVAERGLELECFGLAARCLLERSPSCGMRHSNDVDLLASQHRNLFNKLAA